MERDRSDGAGCLPAGELFGRGGGAGCGKALGLISAFSYHLMSYPMFADHFARLGDTPAVLQLDKWHRWHPVFILALLASGAIFYRMRREIDEPPSFVLALLYSAMFVFFVFVIEFLLVVAFGYLRSKLHRL